MEWYYIKSDAGWYVKVTVECVEFDIDTEEDVILYGYKKVDYQSEATKFEISSQAWDMMYTIFKEESFDVFLEEEKQ